ncbi:MAG: hypothetical protein P4L42_02700 [Desulfocapsaceae bacterium]|nr:hypothetical protein [Desulfocapsaceae bacterium]
MSDKKVDKFVADTSSGQIVRNGIHILIKFALYILIGLFFVPFLVGQFGTTNYGLIALAGILTQYIGLISESVASSVNRFLLVELNRQNWEGANEIFNSAFVAYLGIYVLQMPLFAIGIWKLDCLISFPEAISRDVRYLVFANVVCYGMNLFMGVLGAVLFAGNRLDILSKLETALLVMRTAALFAVLKIFSANLQYVGHIELLIAALRFGIMCAIFRKYSGHLRLDLRKFSCKWFRPVLHMSGWVFLASFGFALFLNTDVWILNRMVSPALAGVYAALLVWPNFIKQIANQVSALLTPVFTIELAKYNTDKVAQLCLVSSRFLVFVTLAVICPVLVFPKELLGMWKPELAQYAYLLPFMIFYNAFTIPESVLWSVFLAENKMYLKGKNDIICGLMNVIFSIALVGFGLGAVGVAVATAVALIIRNGILTPFQVSHLLKSSFRPYAALHAASCMVLAVAFALCGLYHWGSDTFSPLVILSGVFLSSMVGFFLPILLTYGIKQTLLMFVLLFKSMRDGKIESRLRSLLFLSSQIFSR